MLSETERLVSKGIWSDQPRALVTGAASGIGYAVVKELELYTWEVLGMDVNPLPSHPYASFIGSVVEPKHCEQAMRLADPELVVHCAGIGAGTLGLAHSHDMREDQWQNVIQVNLTGSWNVCKAALAYGSVRSIVLVSSISALVNAGRGARNANYAASKAGVIGMAKVLAVEYAPRVRVNVICPGGTETPMVERGRQAAPEMMAQFEADHPRGRFSGAEEVAAMIVAVGTNEAMTGSVVVVDGGYTAC